MGGNGKGSWWVGEVLEVGASKTRLQICKCVCVRTCESTCRCLSYREIACVHQSVNEWMCVTSPTAACGLSSYVCACPLHLFAWTFTAATRSVCVCIVCVCVVCVSHRSAGPSTAVCGLSSACRWRLGSCAWERRPPWCWTWSEPPPQSWTGSGAGRYLGNSDTCTRITVIILSHIIDLATYTQQKLVYNSLFKTSTVAT